MEPSGIPTVGTMELLSFSSTSQSMLATHTLDMVSSLYLPSRKLLTDCISTGIHTYDSDQGSKDVYAFLRIFFSSFDKFQGNDFVMTGESYAGRYLPRYASQIVDQNHRISEKASKEGKKAKKGELINLKKVAIGNGLTDVAVQTPSYYDFTCTCKGGGAPVLSIEECKDLRAWRDRCIVWIKRVCRDTYNKEDCDIAEGTCAEQFTVAYFNTGRNPYNVKDLCLVGLEPNLCYSVMEDIRNYLDREDVRELIGAEPVSSIGKFKTCNNDVAQGFNVNSDENIQNVDYVAGLLERDIDIMIYVGKLDWWVMQYSLLLLLFVLTHDFTF